MHGKFPKYLQEDHVDVEMSFQWMKYTELKGETEGQHVFVQFPKISNEGFHINLVENLGIEVF